MLDLSFFLSPARSSTRLTSTSDGSDQWEASIKSVDQWEASITWPHVVWHQGRGEQAEAPVLHGHEVTPPRQWQVVLLVTSEDADPEEVSVRDVVNLKTLTIEIII